MIRILSLFSVFLLLISGLAFTNKPYPESWPKPLYPIDTGSRFLIQAELGRILFYDPVLSLDSTISCASCHSPYQAFAHSDHALSHGIRDSIGTRNAPALFNLAWNNTFMWDGAIHHLEVQSLFPITHPAEMGETLAHVLEKLNRNPAYRKRFYNAFSDSNIQSEMLLKSLAKFMLGLISDQSRYDSMQRNLLQFNPQEENGYKLFRQHCNQCHTEPLFTSGNFENNGLPADPVLRDPGRVKISLQPEDSFCFKVPTLRNIEYTYPYMHDGRFKTLKQVLQHYQTGIVHSRFLSKSLTNNIELSPNELKDLTAFLLTLSDRKFLFDSSHTFPMYILNSAAKD